MKGAMLLSDHEGTIPVLECLALDGIYMTGKLVEATVPFLFISPLLLSFYSYIESIVMCSRKSCLMMMDQSRGG